MHTAKLLVIGWVLTVALSAPPTAAAVELSFGAGLRYFDYEEFEDGVSLNHETGFIPGMRAGLKQSAYGLDHSIGAGFWNGDVEYDGFTQGFQPHETQTDTTLFSAYYRIDWRPRDSTGSLFAAVSWNEWQRDILPANGIFGLYERYRWWTAEAGIKTEILRQDTKRLEFELGLLLTRNGTIRIDLADLGYGIHSLDLGDSQGFRTALAYSINTSNESRLQFKMEHRFWHFGRSNSKLISNGFNSFLITEPKSDSNHTSFTITYVISY